MGNEVYTVEEVEPGVFQSVFPSEQADMSALHASELSAWHHIAEANGWQIVARDPHGPDYGPVLFHDYEDRVWPLNDPIGAVRDLGLNALATSPVEA